MAAMGTHLVAMPLASLVGSNLAAGDRVMRILMRLMFVLWRGFDLNQLQRFRFLPLSAWDVCNVASMVNTFLEQLLKALAVGPCEMAIFELCVCDIIQSATLSTLCCYDVESI
eukprot:scaffold206989_cov27-Tisochrysis_lutea.AAC.3